MCILVLLLCILAKCPFCCCSRRPRMNLHICLSSLLTVLLFQGRFIDFITVLPSVPQSH